MSWSLNIGKVAGTVVRVHLTFLLFLAWIFAASYASGGAATAWDSLVFMILLFLCVLLHEFGHIFTARAFNVPTPYVTLLPIGGVAQLERIPEEPWEEFLIAIAGPMVNIVITLVLIVLFGAHLQPSAAAAVDNLKIPLVDMVASVADAIRARGLKRVALFGTRSTVESKMFGRLGVDVVMPQPDEIAFIHDRYLDVVYDRSTPEKIDRLRELAHTLIKREGAEAVLLAGTDLSMVMNEQNAGFPTLDCAGVHTAEITRRLLG